MRIGMIPALIIAVALTAKPALAVNHEAAFNLCAAQPNLQADWLGPLIEYQMSRPHPPQFDTMSNDQIMNFLQYYGAMQCAENLVAHPDVFAAIVIEQFTSKDRWDTAWVAFNSYCGQNMTGACIKAEVDAFDAIIAANKRAGGWAPLNRLCTLALPDDADPVELRRCIKAAGDTDPGKKTADRCEPSVGWHSHDDPVAAGRAIARCIARPP